MTNRQGLSRNIPADVKRTIRQRDGFGCIRCGSAIYTYEHVDPPFEEAEAHEPVAITLLCAGCHDLVTRGLLSKETVRKLMATPRCREVGFSFGPLDVGQSFPTVMIGPVTLKRVAVVLRVSGDDVLRIDPPEEMGAPYRISAHLANQSGSESLRIVENEWRSSAGNWDVEVVGQRVTIHDAPRDIALAIRTDPPHRLVIERLRMYHRGVQINADGSNLTVSAGGRNTFTAHSAQFDGNAVGIDVDATGSARLGSGGGSVHVGQMVVGGDRAIGRSLAPRRALEPARLSPVIGPGNSPQMSSSPKQGRNERCGCGSGRKFKNCHGREKSN